jgi:hypothetical protein
VVGKPDELFEVEAEALHDQNSEVALRAYEDGNAPTPIRAVTLARAPSQRRDEPFHKILGTPLHLARWAYIASSANAIFFAFSFFALTASGLPAA